MDYSEWKGKTDGFKKVDVRGVAGNFLDGIKKQAASLPAGEGMEIIQTFEPIPLYEVMEILGYEHQTEKVSDEDYEEYICSADMDEDDYARLMQDGSRKCPFWRNGDEYAVVRHQI